MLNHTLYYVVEVSMVEPIIHFCFLNFPALFAQDFDILLLFSQLNIYDDLMMFR